MLITGTATFAQFSQATSAPTDLGTGAAVTARMLSEPDPPNRDSCWALRLAVAFQRPDGLAPEPPAGHVAWFQIEVPACRVSPWCGSKEVRALADPVLGMPTAVPIPW
jgi:hypothetical protein